MRRWILPTLVALFVMAGSLKGIPAIRSLPLDFTLTTALAVWFALGHRALQTGWLPRQILPVLAVFSVLAIPVLWTHFSPYGTQKVERLFLLTLPACLAPIVLFNTKDQLQRLILAWAGVASIVLATAVLYPVPAGTYEGAPLESVNVDTIGLGQMAGLVLVVAVLALLYRRALRGTGRIRVLAAAAIIASTSVLLAAGSRGPLLAVIVAMVAATLMTPERRLVFTISALLLVGGAVAYTFRWAPEASQSRILAAASGSLNNSTLNRLNLISIARTQIAAHVFGLGWGGFEDPAPGPYRYPHDIILEVLAEGGWLPGLIFLGWICAALMKARRTATNFGGTVVFTLLIFTFVNSLVSGDINDNRMLFLAIGISVAVNRFKPLATKPPHIGIPQSAEVSDPTDVAF